MRHPVARVWSYYQMAVRNKRNPWHRYATDIKTFLEHCWEVNNVVTQYFSLKIRSSILTFEDYEAAIKVLKNLYFVLKFENLDTDFGTLRDKIKADYECDIGKLESLNLSQGYYTPSKKDVEIIQVRNMLDIMLYEVAFESS